MRVWPRIGALILLLCAGACSTGSPPPERFASGEVTFADLKDWPADDHAQALDVFLSSCDILAKKSKAATASSNLQIPETVWRSLCDDARSQPRGDTNAARLFFERRFVPYRVSNDGKEKGLFTGYYEPVLYGSRRKSGHFIYPLYAPPADIKTRKPHYSHAEIDQGRLAGKGLEVAWVDDPVMLFFLQIQGSGRIRYGDGSEQLMGYAGQNGHPYQSLGKIMGDEGRLPKDQINFFTLRQWLYDHPTEALSMMERNPSYVFFKPLNRAGAVGAVGNVLTPRRSMAVDSRYIPYGLPLYLETELPGPAGAASAPFRRIMVAQDTGGAIRGPVRGDIFFGGGNDAEYLAGFMKGKGIYSLLVPREISYQMRP